MATVYFSAEFSEITERLAKGSEKNKPVFSNYMQLMLFASMVGRDKAKDIDIVKLSSKGNEIPERIFTSNHSEGYAYLLALQYAQSGDILRDGNENDCWKVIESYADKGMGIVRDWLFEHPTDTTGVDTLLSKIKEKAEVLVNLDDEDSDPMSDFDIN